jgi:hypothetical protein
MSRSDELENFKPTAGFPSQLNLIMKMRSKVLPSSTIKQNIRLTTKININK